MNTNVQKQTTEVERVQANAQAQAKAAADAITKAEQSEAVKLARKLINADIKAAAGVSEAVFAVILACQDWDEADLAFIIAEKAVLKEKGADSMAELARISGVKQFSYVNIRSTMLAAVKASDKLTLDLQSFYDWNYEQMSSEDQAKNAKEYVPDGFLNPWSNRYRSTDDEKPVTRFNRDRKLATDALGKLDAAKRIASKAKASADKAAAERLQNAMATAAGTADNAPAGSGQTAQGMASGTRGGRVLSIVVQQALNLLINAAHHASDYLADSEVLPILGNAADKLEALIAAEVELERKKMAADSASHDNPVGGEQSELEDGEMSKLPDLDPADDSEMTEADKAHLAAAIEEDLERKAQ